MQRNPSKPRLKLDVVVRACNPRAWEEEEAGGSGVPEQPQLWNELKASLGYMIHSLIAKKIKNKKGCPRKCTTIHNKDRSSGY